MQIICCLVFHPQMIASARLDEYLFHDFYGQNDPESILYF